MNEALKSSVQVLNSKLDALNPNDRQFAKDLIKNFLKNGSLSEKQAYWIDILTERAMGAGNDTPPKTECVGSFAKVMEMFGMAAKKLKYPKINLNVDGKPLSLSLAGKASKAPGTINVTDGGRFGTNLWYGRIDASGVWTQGGKPKDEEMKAVLSFLTKFSKNPSQVASEYGKLSGKCCFCNLPLTDEKSTAVGYGPTCAENFGLKAEWKAGTPVLSRQMELTPSDNLEDNAYYRASKGY